MTVAVSDAFRSIKINGATVGTIAGTAVAPSVGAEFTLTSGIGIALVADPATNSVTILNTGSGSGAFTTVNDQNASGTYYPLFTRAPGPGDFDALSGQYHMDTIYLDQTTTPMTYNPSTGTLTIVTLSGNVSATSVGTSTFTASTTAAVGTDANFTDWPNAKFVSSQANSGDSHSYNMGVVGEAVATSGDLTRWGVGVYGKGSTNSGTRSAGVQGDGGVTNSADTGSAVGVRGYATDTHTGGYNVALRGEASGSSVGNYALVMTAGNIWSEAAQSWLLYDNTSSSLTIDTAGKTGILSISTVNSNEGVSMSGTLTVTGHTTFEGVTSTGATGTGNLVYSNSPSFTTPTLGAASATSVNKLTITAPTTSAILTIADGKTFAVNNSITLSGTDLTTITLPATDGTVALNNQTFYIGTTSVAINRTSGSQTLNGVSIDGNAATVTNGFYTSSSFNLGTTSIAVNRASAAQSLTGITSIDGYAASLAGGNNTTLLGSVPYQSAANTTSLLSPNTTTTKKFLRMTGDGTNGAAPAWDTVLASDISGTISSSVLGNSTLYVGTTSIALNRASAAQSLTGITSIDGYAASLAGGNNTTLLGSMPYQSAANTTSLVNPNTTTTKKFLRMTGDGTNGAVPAWDTIVAGDIPTLNQNTTGYATNLAGGNNTTLQGSIPYQSAVNTTTLLSPNTTTTRKFVRMTGDGTNGAAPAWDTLTTGDIPAHYIGTTSITFSRASGSQSLTGITSIDGYAGGLAGGNSTTLLGSVPYQSDVNVTTLLSPNTTTTRKFLRMVGTGSNGAAPVWDTITASDVPTLNQNTTGSAGSVANALTISTGLALNSGTTYNGSAAVTLTIDSTVATLTGTQTLTNKRVTPRPNVTTSGSGSFSFNTDSMDHISLTGISGTVTLSVTGTPTEGQRLMIKLKDDGTARTVNWTTTSGNFRAVGMVLPTTTVAGRVMYVGCIYNNTDGYWDVVSMAQY